VNLSQNLCALLFNLMILIVIVKGKFYVRHLYGNIMFITCSDLTALLTIVTRNMLVAFYSNAHSPVVCKVFIVIIQYTFMNSLHGVLLLSFEFFVQIKNIAVVHEKLFYNKPWGMLCFVLV
jgi:hypothetical protein